MQAIEQDDRATARQILSEALYENPGDQEVRFLYARVLSWSDERAAALAQYDELLSTSPQNSDYLLGKAQVLYWNRDARLALPLLEQARQLTPDYAAVWQLEARVLMAIGDADSQTRFSQLVEQARVRFPASEWPDWPPDAPPPAPVDPIPLTVGYLELGTGRQNLSDGQADWKSLYLNGHYQLGEHQAVYGGLRQIDRFDQKDQEIRAGMASVVGYRSNVLLEATRAPDAEVLPRWSLYSEFNRPLQQSYGIGIGLRHSSYAENHLNMLNVTGSKYFGDYHATWTVYLSKLEGADATVANQFRIDRYYDGDNRVGLLIAAGRETESVGQGQFVEDDTFSAVISGLHRIAPTWSVSWDLIYHDQGDAYSRGGARVGLRRQF